MTIRTLSIVFQTFSCADKRSLVLSVLEEICKASVQTSISLKCVQLYSIISFCLLEIQG